jgi:hypothetical protein
LYSLYLSAEQRKVRLKSAVQRVELTYRLVVSDILDGGIPSLSRFEALFPTFDFCLDGG